MCSTATGLWCRVVVVTTWEGTHVLVAGDRLGGTLRDETVARGAARVSHYYGAAELSFVPVVGASDAPPAAPGLLAAASTTYAGTVDWSRWETSVTW